VTTRRENVAAHLILVVASIVAIYPLLSILMLALSPPGERPTGLAMPSELYFGNFSAAWTRGHFASALLSSAIVTFAVVLTSVALSVVAGYAFGTMKFPGRDLLFGVLTIGLVLPFEAMIIPMYFKFRDVGLLNTYWAVILPQIGASVAFGTYWMRSYFKKAPKELIEAALVDGASRRRILRSVLLPLAAPAALTLGALLFLFTWNDFLLALVMLSENRDAQTAPLALSFFAGNKRNQEPAVTAAAAILVALPVLVAYVAMQRRFVRGLYAGAVKG
jgi:raffinose/stachyose/melibiose transport system permease protein